MDGLSRKGNGIRMKWHEVSVTTNEAAADTVSDLLLGLGANGVELVDPEAFRRVLAQNSHLDYADEGFLDQYGTDVVVRAYFQDGREVAALRQAVVSGIGEMAAWLDPAPGKVSVLLRDDAEWKDVWKEYYRPFAIAPGFVIKPSWEAYEAKPGETVIEMDPGMAFGTGTHETTRMCARFAAEVVAPGDRVMDIGCGTAVLGIIAALKGARHVTAIDIDDAAVKTARENVARNGVEDRVAVVCGVLEDLAPSAHEVLLVNIIADVIISLAPLFGKYLVPGGRLVTSGIIHERMADVVAACEQNGFTLLSHEADGEWDAMVFACIGS